MPLLGNCCFFIDLKVGTKIIGSLKLIAAIINTIVLIGILLMLIVMGIGVDAAKETHRISATTSSSFDDDYENINEDLSQSDFELIQQNIGLVKAVLYVLLAMYTVLIITASMLIHGVRTNRRNLLLPYIVQEVISLLIFIGIAIAPLIAIGTFRIIVYFSLCVLGGIFIHIYFLLVVISQYQALGLIRMHEEMSMK
ncbi:hypothetical protein Pcinc_010091 [Petrolisthes cinctipes]|uniref:Uncharacterized protein n=1 Tax=Petrolisthes cinctipes TaxID=88211 RepID=A0AAE1G405_PETCI|nr:hypothetical protein Pcinc_010091 [Petrolisthes cinctipes]